MWIKSQKHVILCIYIQLLHQLYYKTEEKSIFFYLWFNVATSRKKMYKKDTRLGVFLIIGCSTFFGLQGSPHFRLRVARDFLPQAAKTQVCFWQTCPLQSFAETARLHWLESLLLKQQNQDFLNGSRRYLASEDENLPLVRYANSGDEHPWSAQ